MDSEQTISIHTKLADVLVPIEPDWDPPRTTTLTELDRFAVAAAVAGYASTKRRWYWSALDGGAREQTVSFLIAIAREIDEAVAVAEDKKISIKDRAQEAARAAVPWGLVDVATCLEDLEMAGMSVTADQTPIAKVCKNLLSRRAEAIATTLLDALARAEVIYPLDRSRGA